MASPSPAPLTSYPELLVGSFRIDIVIDIIVVVVVVVVVTAALVVDCTRRHSFSATSSVELDDSRQGTADKVARCRETSRRPLLYVSYFGPSRVPEPPVLWPFTCA